VCAGYRAKSFDEIFPRNYDKHIIGEFFEDDKNLPRALRKCDNQTMDPQLARRIAEEREDAVRMFGEKFVRTEEARENLEAERDMLKALGVTKEELDDHTRECDEIAESLAWCLEPTEGSPEAHVGGPPESVGAGASARAGAEAGAIAIGKGGPDDEAMDDVSGAAVRSGALCAEAAADGMRDEEVPPPPLVLSGQAASLTPY
jgi:hypothetical protein